MERYEKRKRLGWIIILLLLIALSALFYFSHIQNERIARELEQVAKEENAKLERVNKEKEIYATIATNTEIPQFVFWGDSSVIGNEEGTLPDCFDKEVNAELFSSLKRKMTDYDQVQDGNESVHVNVVNMGICDEGMNEILVRTGANQLVTAEEYTISNHREKKDIDLTDGNGNPLRFVKQPHALFNTVTISGIEGRFYFGKGYYETGERKIAFAREKSGDSVVVPKGTRIKISSIDDYKDYIPVLFFDSRIETDNDQFINDLKAILKQSEKASDYYVVICTTSPDQQLDQMLSEEFSEHYILNKKTTEAMTNEDYRMLAKATYKLLNEQGCFEGTKTQVGEAETELEMLK